MLVRTSAMIADRVLCRVCLLQRVVDPAHIGRSYGTLLGGTTFSLEFLEGIRVNDLRDATRTVIVRLHARTDPGFEIDLRSKNKGVEVAYRVIEVIIHDVDLPQS
jgi:hypothetical protein